MLGLLLTAPVWASSYYATVEKISVREGLPDTTVYSLAKDGQGFLWLGTPTSLARYDGYQFRNFRRVDYGDLAADGRVVSHASHYSETSAHSDHVNFLHTVSAANIFIDSKQRLWIGTWGEGLVVYDDNMELIGHHLHNPEQANSIGSDRVQTIFEDSDGDIWIGSNGGGLALYNEQSKDFTNFLHDVGNTKSISHNRVWDITQTDDGRLWVATSDGLNLMRKDNMGEFRRFRHNPSNKLSINHELVRAIFARGNELWLGTEIGFGAFDTRRYEFAEIDLFAAKEKSAITRIVADNDHGIWIGTQQGLFRFETNTGRLTPLASEDNVQLFPHNDVRDIELDESGVLWVATRYAGVLKVNLTSNNFSFYQHYRANGRIDNSINRVYALHVDKRDAMWLGLDDGLLRMELQSGEISRINSRSLYNNMRIDAIVEANDGVLWLGGPFGLASFDIERQQFKDQSVILANLSDKRVSSLLMDSRGDLWVGTTNDGLLRYNSTGKLTWFKHDESDASSISGNDISVLFEDQLKRVWVGTKTRGANRYDKPHDKFVRYSANSRQINSLNNNDIEVIYQTQDSVMWFGTPKFLSALDDSSGSFRHFGERDGLISSNIKGIVEDNKGDLWISTVKGLIQYRRSEEHFFNFTDKDDLVTNEFVERSVAKADDGRLFFGNVSGFHQVQPEEVKINHHIPNVVITNVWIDNKPVPRYRFDRGGVVELPHSAKSIRLQFAALDFLAPSKNLYQYRLDGFDGSWTDAATTREVTYTSLNPGSYRFAVKGSNNSNQWNQTSADLDIVVYSPWWGRWWVVIGLALFLVLLAYGWNHYRMRVISAHKRRLEREVELRTKELSQQKDELLAAHQQLNEQSEVLKAKNKELSDTLEQTAHYQDELVEKEKMAALGKMVAGIAHEINTPIGLGVTATTLMQDRMAVIKQDFADKVLSPAQLKRYLAEGEESLDIIFRNLERAAELIRSFKQVSVDQSSDERRRFGLLQLIDEVLLSLKPNLKKVQHQVTVDCDPQIKVRSKPGAVSQILINLISNSLLHAFDDEHPNGMMKIEVSIEQGNCYLRYSDNGSGISEDMEARIFEPFATSKRAEGGSGLGMHLVYNLATQALGGTITMTNHPGKGVEFCVIFPIGE